MSQIIGSVIGGTVADVTGRGHQGHLHWATNDAAWWHFHMDSTTLNKVQTFRSPDGVTWTAKTASGALTANYNSSGKDIAVAYKNISSNDTFHVNVLDAAYATDNIDAFRATTASAAITWGALVAAYGNVNSAAGSIGSCYSDDNFPYIPNAGGGNAADGKASNADLGSSWTSGFGANQNGLDTSPSLAINSIAGLATSSNRIQHVYDDGGNATTMTSLRSTTWDGTTIGSNLVIASSLSNINKNDWTVCRVSDTDIHAIWKTAAGTYGHARWNGTDWTTLSAATPASQNTVSGSGLFMVSNGTDCWLFIIDSDSPNTVRYNKYSTSGNSWGGWTALESSTQTRKFISGSPELDASGNIGVIWTQTNGSNFDVVFSSLGTAAAAAKVPYNPWLQMAPIMAM